MTFAGVCGGSGGHAEVEVAHSACAARAASTSRSVGTGRIAAGILKSARDERRAQSISPERAGGGGAMDHAQIVEASVARRDAAY